MLAQTTASHAEQTQQIVDFIVSDAPKAYLKKGHDDYARKRFVKGLDYFIERLERIGCPTDAKVIDVGCGAGNWAIAQAARGGEVYAFDREPGFAKLGEDISQLIGVDDRAEWAVGTAEDPASFQPADFALVNNSMMWIYVDGFIQVLSQFLPAGGKMYGNYSAVAARVNVSLIGLSRKAPAHIARGLNPIYRTSMIRVGLPSTHISYSLTAAELLGLFAAYGYQHIDAPHAHDWKSATEDAIVDFTLEYEPDSRIPTREASPETIRELFELEADTAVLEATKPLTKAKAAGVLDVRARVLLRRRRMEEAAKIVKRMPKYSIAPVLYDVQRVLDGEGTAEDALSRLERAKLSDEEEYVRHFVAGVVLLDKERAAEARPHFEKAVELNPTWRGGHSGLLLAMVDDFATDEQGFTDAFRRMIENAELGIPAGAVTVPEP